MKNEFDFDKIMEKEILKEETSSKFTVKDEVKLVCKRLPSSLKIVEGLVIGKIGRVVGVIENKILVDFWDTKPAKVAIDASLLELVTPASEIAKLSAHYIEPSNDSKKVSCLLADGGSVSLEGDTITFEIPAASPLKADTGKERVDLINPNFILEIGKVLGYGATKYPNGDYNYIEGQGLEYSRIYASLNRHILKWYSGEQIDPETGIHHLVHAAANLQFLFNYDTMNKGIDNRRFKK